MGNYECRSFASVAEFTDFVTEQGYVRAAPDLYSHPQWFSLLEEVLLSEGQQTRVWMARNEDGFTALPLALDANGGIAGAKGWRSLSNYYTPLFSPLKSFGFDGGEALVSLFKLASQQEKWHWVDFEPLSQQSKVQLLEVLEASGFSVFPYFRFGNWYQSLDGCSFQEYAAGLSSRLRNTVVRREKKLNKSGEMTFQLFQDEKNLEQGIQAYWHVYQASWKLDEPHPEFINKLVCWAAREKWLRLGVIYLDGQACAVQLWFVYNGVASIYKLAYREDFKHLSPGTVLSWYMFKHVIDVDQVEEIDYLVGDDAYKSDWMSQRRARWGVVAFNRRTILGRLLAAKESMVRYVKARLNRPSKGVCQ